MTKEFKNIQEKIASGQLARLKKEYGKLKHIDWSKHKDQVKKTTAMLKKLNIRTLIDLSKEDIPMISDVAKSLVLKDKRFAHHVTESAISKQFRKNEDENRHTENYLLLAKEFGSKSDVKAVEAIIKRNKSRGHTSVEDNKWMHDNLSQHFRKVR